MPPQPVESICLFCLVKRSEMRQYATGLASYICGLCDRQPTVAEPLMDSIKHQPWNDREVASLSEYQQSPMFCPYVCEAMHKLTVASDGLHCKDCSFKLAWAYKWTLDGSWKPPRPFSPAQVPNSPVKPSNGTEAKITEDIPLKFPKKEELV